MSTTRAATDSARPAGRVRQCARAVTAAVVSLAPVALVHAAEVSHVPGAPHPTISAAVDSSACPIYFVEFGQRLESGRLVLSGRISNAGPGTARLVTVEAHAIAKEGGELATYSSLATPAVVSGGSSARFEIVLPLRDWERERSDTAFDRSRVEEHVARCEASEQDPTDPQGNTRSSYRRRVFSATEERTLLQHRLRVVRGEVHSAIIRNERAAYGELPEIRRRVDELDDMLTRELGAELPESARSAGAPAEWVAVPR